MSVLQSAKLFLLEATNLSKDALHVYVGLTVLLVAVIAFKRSLGDWRPIAAVAFASVAGEVWGVIDTLTHGATPKWDANWKDVWNTMFWPLVLFALARWTRLLKR